MEFSFDVATSSHDLLMLEITEWRWVRVVVEAQTVTEGALVAAQMAACQKGMMPTRVLYRE